MSQVGQSHGVVILLAIDGNDPIARLEAGPLRGGIVPDRRDRSRSELEPEVEKMVRRDRQLRGRFFLGFLLRPLELDGDRPLVVLLALSQEFVIILDGFEHAAFGSNGDDLDLIVIVEAGGCLFRVAFLTRARLERS
jgi:hypothetical protein